MAERHKLSVEAPTRLDQLLARRWQALDHQQIQALITGGAVLVNRREARKPGQRLMSGDEVLVDLPELPAPAPAELPLGLTLTVAYEDDVLLVVDKPADVPVRRSRSPDQATLPQILAAMYPDRAHVGGVNRAGVVTTLDEEVSGLVLVGKAEKTYRALRRLVKRQYVTESYTALVEGKLRGEHAIDQPIGNVKRARRRLAVTREGRPTRTVVCGQQNYREGGRNYTLVLVRPESSRMHQIRVHLAWYGFPIVGDRLYGSSQQPLLPNRPFLHLSEMRLLHPVNDEELRVESRLPAELHSVLDYMRRPGY